LANILLDFFVCLSSCRLNWKQKMASRMYSRRCAPACDEDLTELTRKIFQHVHTQQDSANT
jgi:hypothetical protein